MDDGMRNCPLVLAVSCCLACLTVGIPVAMGWISIAPEEEPVYISEGELVGKRDFTIPWCSRLQVPAYSPRRGQAGKACRLHRPAWRWRS